MFHKGVRYISKKGGLAREEWSKNRAMFVTLKETIVFINWLWIGFA